MTDPITPQPAPAGPDTPAFSAAPPPPLSPAPKKSRAWVTPVLGIVAALVIGLFGGVLIGHATAGNSDARGAGFRQGLGGAGGGTGTGQGFGGGAGTGQGNGGTGQGGAQGGFAGGGFTAGTIVSIDGSKIVIKEADGTEKTITTSGDTTVTKTSKSSVDALKSGEKVSVVGTTNSDGTVTARVVTEGAGARFGVRPGGAGSGTNG